MKPLWNGDRRDRVKWGGLVHLAEREAILNLAVVLLARDDTPRELISSGAGGAVPLPEAVWDHSSSFANLYSLGEAAGLHFHLFDTLWQRPRADYFAAVAVWFQGIAGPKIVFLDPDTGLGNATDGLKHVRPAELTGVWDTLNPGDWLALYQHGHRETHWRHTKFAAFQACCPGGHAESFAAPSIADDVMLFASRHP